MSRNASNSKRVTSTNLIPLCVLHILEDHSDYNHKLTQEEIIKYLVNEYQVEKVERRSIGRAISRLRDELDYQIESEDRVGSWLDQREFEDSELQMLIDSVFTSKYIPKSYAQELINKIKNLGSEYFDAHVKYTSILDDIDRSINKTIYINIDIIEDALERKCQVEFDFNKYDIDKKLYVTSHNKVTCIRTVVHNGRYYLLAWNEKYKNKVFYRMDHITNMKVLDWEKSTPIRTIPGFENGFSNKALGSNLPYMYTDKQEKIVFYAAKNVIDQMIEWLGFGIEITKLPGSNDEKYKLEITTSPMAFKYFALQYLNQIEVLQPKSLRDDIRDTIKEGLKTYK